MMKKLFVPGNLLSQSCIEELSLLITVSRQLGDVLPNRARVSCIHLVSRFLQRKRVYPPQHPSSLLLWQLQESVCPLYVIQFLQLSQLNCQPLLKSIVRLCLRSHFRQYLHIDHFSSKKSCTAHEGLLPLLKGYLDIFVVCCRLPWICFQDETQQVIHTHGFVDLCRLEGMLQDTQGHSTCVRVQVVLPTPLTPNRRQLEERGSQMQCSLKIVPKCISVALPEEFWHRVECQPRNSEAARDASYRLQLFH
mmetsp:Transcript_34564/g.85001  ORF Transcript_34564/g.85001 Transcript_34564/m.85001 type:complete len:250 (-) Transcript_34564:236-985(-)